MKWKVEQLLNGQFAVKVYWSHGRPCARYISDPATQRMLRFESEQAARDYMSRPGKAWQ